MAPTMDAVVRTIDNHPKEAAMKLAVRPRAALAPAILARPAAQDYPTKPIKLIVPFPPGAAPTSSRASIGKKLAETLKWVVVIDNKPGAGGNIGVDAAAKSPPDGYTMVMGQTSNLAINPTLYTKLPYDPMKDLAPVVLVAYAPLVLVRCANSPFKSLADVVAAAKTKPGHITFASPGNGTVAHLTGELFQNAAGVKFQHIPYKGSAQAITDLMGGQVQIFMSSMPTALSQIKGGQAAGDRGDVGQRAAELPDVPTIAESGYKGFDANTWFGLLVPAKTPPGSSSGSTPRSTRFSRTRRCARSSRPKAAKCWAARRRNSLRSSRPTSAAGARS